MFLILLSASAIKWRASWLCAKVLYTVQCYCVISFYTFLSSMDRAKLAQKLSLLRYIIPICKIMFWNITGYQFLCMHTCLSFSNTFFQLSRPQDPFFTVKELVWSSVLLLWKYNLYYSVQLIAFRLIEGAPSDVKAAGLDPHVFAKVKANRLIYYIGACII